MNTEAISRIATVLLEARRTQQPADAEPLAGLLQTADEAYAVQDEVARQGAFHAPGLPRWWKSGGPSRTAKLTNAALPDAGVWTSPGDATRWPMQIRSVEAEIALRIGQDVTPEAAADYTHDTAASLVDAMAVSIELVDSHWRQSLGATALLKLADLQCHGALVLGAWTPFVARDWSQQQCDVTIGAGAPRRFTGTHSLQDPCWLLPVWLRHATRGGRTVPAGTVVTTGTWCGLLYAQPGEEVQVRFEGIGEASVRM